MYKCYLCLKSNPLLKFQEQLSLQDFSPNKCELSKEMRFVETEMDACKVGLEECLKSNRRVGFLDENSRVTFDETIPNSPSTHGSSAGNSLKSDSEEEFDEDLMDRFYKNYDSDDSFHVRAVRKSSCPPTLN